MDYHPSGVPPLCELHVHLGASVPAFVLWSLAHEQGIKLPTKNYWEFEAAVTMKGTVQHVEELTAKVYDVTHLIQSSPQALPSIVQHAVSGAYRHSNITWQEWRINPMRRNRSGEHDLDYTILALLHGLDKVKVEFPFIKAGFIFEMYRGYGWEENSIILDKAIKYKNRGVIGIDLSGPQTPGFDIKEYAGLFQRAKDHGLGVTIHTGEEGDLAEMAFVVDEICPDRIGHGVLAHKFPKLMETLVRKGIVLELCPTSNMNCSVFTDRAMMKKAVHDLHSAGVLITFNTDGADAHCTSLIKEFELFDHVFSEEKLLSIRQNAFRASFLRRQL